jgi:hypothetical protein
MRDSMSNGGMAEDRIDRKQVLSDVQRHARVSLQGVPERVIVGDLALGGDLRRRGFQLLQADDVRPLARQPFAQLRGAGANTVHVPGRDSHARKSSLTGSAPH